MLGYWVFFPIFKNLTSHSWYLGDEMDPYIQYICYIHIYIHIYIYTYTWNPKWPWFLEVNPTPQKTSPQLQPKQGAPFGFPGIFTLGLSCPEFGRGKCSRSFEQRSLRYVDATCGFPLKLGSLWEGTEKIELIFGWVQNWLCGSSMGWQLKGPVISEIIPEIFELTHWISVHPQKVWNPENAWKHHPSKCLAGRKTWIWESTAEVGSQAVPDFWTHQPVSWPLFERLRWRFPWILFIANS